MMLRKSQRDWQQTGPRLAQRAAGFSLFELVVFIISVAIIYAYAANRFADFPGQAERANFLAITTQISSAVNLEMLYGVGVGRISSPQKLEGANPMDLLLEPPTNYIGAFDAVDTSRLDRRVWYFDRSRQELVYLVNDASGVALLVNGREVPTNEIRFRLEADYSLHDEETGLPVRVLESAGEEVPEESRVREFNGIVMRPVTPYKWGEVEYGVLLQEAVAQRS
jgi:type II secretory pathway pseudopilin PulG